MSESLRFEDPQPLLRDLSGGPGLSKAWFDLRLQAEQLSLDRGFERLLSLEGLPLQLYEHQRKAVFRVLREMRGRAVLADEVGLGKTVEAGVILREYQLRGLVRTVLVLVPANLVDQWVAELTQKLAIPARRVTAVGHWRDAECAVVSLDLAKGERHAPIALARPWDLVIVDEAHRLKSHTSRNWQFVNALQKKYLLLLTATPVQNDLRELYNLITLLKPGQLKTYAAFRKEFTEDRHSPRNLERLRDLLSEVMVRTSRREARLRLPQRSVRSWWVRLTAPERAFHDALVHLLRRSYRARRGERRNVLPLLLLLRQVNSHIEVAAASLRAMARRGALPEVTPAEAEAVARLATGVEPAKGTALLRLIERVRDEHVVVFTGFRRTLQRLDPLLRARGLRVHTFHGGLDAAARAASIRAFEKEGGILLSTDAGSEGMNLSFCRWVVNYDLPWNPCRLEQRIGRVHRLGQRREVRVDNLAGEGTIEAYIVHLLEKKIAMFDRVVGELEAILGNLQVDFDGRLGEAYLAATGDAEVLQTVEALGDRVASACRSYRAQSRLIDRLFAPFGADGEMAHVLCDA